MSAHPVNNAFDTNGYYCFLVGHAGKTAKSRRTVQRLVWHLNSNDSASSASFQGMRNLRFSKCFILYSFPTLLGLCHPEIQFTASIGNPWQFALRFYDIFNMHF